MNHLLRTRGAARAALGLVQPNRSFTGSEKSVRIAIIGAGKMAEAICLGLRRKEGTDKFPRALTLHVFDINKGRMEFFQKSFKAEAHPTMSNCVEGADLIILACKPQNVESVAKKVGKVAPSSVVLSILAGTTVAKLQECFKVDKIVRSMPNTPAQVGEGMTVWTATETLSSAERELCGQVMGAFGEQLFVDQEHYLDMATAISGSGPAYVLLLMEAMIDTGVHFGFPRAVATRLVHQTVKGTAIYAKSSDLTSPSLRSDITSPGGTTAAALYSLESGGFRTVVADGLWSAYRRSLELGGNDSNVGPGRYRN